MLQVRFVPWAWYWHICISLWWWVPYTVMWSAGGTVSVPGTPTRKIKLYKVGSVIFQNLEIFQSLRNRWSQTICGPSWTIYPSLLITQHWNGGDNSPASNNIILRPLNHWTTSVSFSTITKSVYQALSHAVCLYKYLWNSERMKTVKEWVSQRMRIWTCHCNSMPPFFPHKYLTIKCGWH